MGTLVNGINRAIRGRVGTVIGSSWKGIPYVKTRHKKRNKKSRRKKLITVRNSLRRKAG